MLNLHEVMPNFFTENEFVAINLDALYKQHCPHSHMKALEMIFAEGVRYSDEVGDHNALEVEALQKQVADIEGKYESQLTELRSQLKAAQEKYEALRLKMITPVAEPDSELQKKVIAQTLNMGNVLR
jgi:esterase/lipase